MKSVRTALPGRIVSGSPSTTPLLLRVLASAALVAVGVLAMLLPAQAAAEALKVVTIGFAGPLSGPAAAMGLSQKQAVELALAETNARGIRLDGTRVVFKLLAQDDRGDARTAALMADYLVRSEVVAVIGHWNTAASISAGKIYDAAGIAQIAPGSTGRQYTQAGYKNAFRIVGHDDDGGIHASHYAIQNLQAQRIVVIDDNTDFGRMLADQFVKGLRQQGKNAVTRQSVSSKTSDFNSVLTESKTQHADLIFFAGLGPQVAALAHNIKRMDLNVRLLAADGTVGPLFLQLAGTDGDRTFGLAPGAAQEKMIGWKKFREKFAAAYGDHIEYFAPFAYDAAQLIIAAIRQANSAAPARIASSLHTLKYNGLTGVISFDPEGNLNNPAYTIYQVQGDKWIAVQSFN